MQWRDSEAELTLERAGAAFYGPLEGIEGGREVLGMMRANGAEECYPFFLQAVAAEPVGGQETVSLKVGDAALDHPAAAGAKLEPTGFTYTAEGQLVAGDLQLLDVAMSEQLIQQTTTAT